MRYRFGDHLLDTGLRELRLGASAIALEPQVFDLLAYLIAHRDRVVGKDELFDAVWAGRIVSESALTTRVAAVRRALGDSGEAQSLIRTVARKGVRFVGEVTPEEAAPPLSGAALAPSERPSIAVLPFANMSRDPEQEYFADGLTEDIITALSKWRWFLVIARNSSFTYKGQAVDVKQVGRELGVRYVLEGSTRKLGSRVRVTAQLIDAESGMHVWAERYDRELTDVFAVQDEVTQSVAGAIEPALAATEAGRAIKATRSDVAAWEHCLRGTWHFHHYDAPSTERAFACFTQALEADAGLADAHVGLARVCLLRAAFQFSTTRDASLRGAGEAARRALTLDREHVVAHYALAISHAYLGDSATAAQHARRAVELNANYAPAHAALALSACFEGRHEEALEANSRAMRLSPSDGQFFVWLAHRATALYLLGRDTEAVDMARRCCSLRWYYTAARVLAAGLARLGDLDGAREAVRLMLATEAGDKTIAQAVATFGRAEDRERLADGLRLAGLPESATAK